MFTSRRKQFSWLFAFSFLIIANGFSQNNHPDAHYNLLKGKSYVQSKNYYLLTLFDELPEVKKLLAADAYLGSLGKLKTDSLKAALKTCEKDGLCYTSHLKFSDAEIKQVGEKLKALYQPANALGKLVKEHLLPSGTYVLFQNLPADEMLVKAWTQDAEGVNFAIGVYAEGKKPNYPLIDSISFTTRDPRNPNAFSNGFISLLYNASYMLATENESKPTFYSLSMNAALHFIEINERNQAADFEPMTAGENKAALDRMKTIKWDQYKYSLILIPGAGPDEPEVALSAEGMIRCRLAAIQYHKGLAPFIVTSGGKVHPYKTKYCEATEMKKYMVEELHIPASAIIIDPHARHTTTNMRNTVRMMYRYGMPFSKAAITCTTRGQSGMIEKTLIARCLKELNEAPYKNGVRLSETEVEFYPLIDALHINPTEPMDP
ncbi:MAG: YdcF family protein [Chitinophagaceae bacterium]